MFGSIESRVCWLERPKYGYARIARAVSCCAPTGAGGAPLSSWVSVSESSYEAYMVYVCKGETLFFPVCFVCCSCRRGWDYGRCCVTLLLLWMGKWEGDLRERKSANGGRREI